MKMQVLLAGALLVNATAFAPARAGSWNTELGATWGAGSVGSASATAVLPGEENADAKIGEAIDSDSATHVRKIWSRTYQDEAAPTDPQWVSFLIKWSGNIDYVQERNGYAISALDGSVSNDNPYAFTRGHAEKLKERGVLVSNDSVNETPFRVWFQDPHVIQYDEITKQTSFTVDIERCTPHTSAIAWFDNTPTSGGTIYGSASAISGAATMGTVQNGIEIVPWPY